MNTYIIVYELNQVNGNYKPFIDKIDSISESIFACIRSMKIIKTNLSPTDIRSILKEYLYDGDKLFISLIGPIGASYGLDENCNKWLRNYL